MPLSENGVERLQALQSLIEEEKFDEVLTECPSLASLIKQEREDDDNEQDHDKKIDSILLEIQLKAHLHLDQLKEAIDLEKSKGDEEDRLGPLVAYAQYRLKNFSEAKSVSSKLIKSSSKNNNILTQHILAQSLYRLGETEESWKKYHSISAEEDDVERIQLLTNALAVRNANANPCGLDDEVEEGKILSQAREKFSKEMSENDAIPFDLYEMVYNLATYELLFAETGDEDAAEKAESMLKAAEDAVRGEINDDDELLEDLAPILTNLAWSQQRRHIEGDPYPVEAKATKFITSHNTSLAKGSTTKKEADLPLTITPLQRRLYHYNKAVLAFQRKQYAVVKKEIQNLQHCITADGKKNSNTPTAPCAFSNDLDFWKSRIAVLEAHVLEENGKKKEAEQLLKKQSYKSDYAASWTRLHLKRMEGQLESPKDRLTVLETCLPSSIESKPAVLATRAMLYQKLGREMPKELLNENQRGEILFSQGKYEEALPYFESESDKTSRAKYILCLTYTNPDKAQEIAGEGNNFDFDASSLISELNADALEAEEIPRVKSTRSSVNYDLPLSSSTSNLKKKSRESIMKQRAKKREAHLEKLRERGIDTSKKPDPERWLPKFERKNQRNRRRRQQHRGAQGGYSQAEAAKLDVANRAAPSAKSTAHMEVVGGEVGRRGRRRR